MSKGCGCCANVSISRRDFRNGADIPEEMPHKKAGRKKGKGTKRSDHKHIWETNGWEKVYRYKNIYNNGVWQGTILDKTNWYLIRRYECLECGKAGKVNYQWPDRDGYWFV